MTKQRRIMLPTVADAKEFVSVASKCDFDIDVFYNRVIIDAKSILGVLSLDLTRVLTVSYSGENQEFEEFLDEKARQDSRSLIIPEAGKRKRGAVRPQCGFRTAPFLGSAAWKKSKRRGLSLTGPVGE